MMRMVIGLVVAGSLMEDELDGIDQILVKVLSHSKNKTRPKSKANSKLD